MSEELVSSDVPLPGALREFLLRVTRLYAEGDPERIVEGIFTPDAVYADHRPLSNGTVTGTEALIEFARRTLELLPDFRVSVHLLAQRGDVYLARDTYDGHAVLGGGEAVMQWWVVDELRDGMLAREDIYETEELARAEYERRIG